MRMLWVGLAGLVLAACGGEGDAEQTYGAKPSADTTDASGAAESPNVVGGEPSGQAPSTPDPSGGGVPVGTTPSQNQSSPMRAS